MNDVQKSSVPTQKIANCPKKPSRRHRPGLSKPVQAGDEAP
jgi:hypothetical protein